MTKKVTQGFDELEELVHDGECGSVLVEPVQKYGLIVVDDTMVHILHALSIL